MKFFSISAMAAILGSLAMSMSALAQTPMGTTPAPAGTVREQSLTPEEVRSVEAVKQVATSAPINMQALSALFNSTAAKRTPNRGLVIALQTQEACRVSPEQTTDIVVAAVNSIGANISSGDLYMIMAAGVYAHDRGYAYVEPLRKALSSMLGADNPAVRSVLTRMAIQIANHTLDHVLNHVAAGNVRSSILNNELLDELFTFPDLISVSVPRPVTRVSSR